jgi:hypothetical protein
MNTPASTTREPAAPATLKGAWRTWISVALILHMLAVVAAPLSVPPSSELFGRMFGVFRPYLEAAYLNHGYHFFGPDPGPGHKVRYVIELADGKRIEGAFPDRNEHRPRLMYHRHFMLSERLAGIEAGEPWIKDYVRSYAAHLQKKHNARRVTLYLQRHLIPFPDQVQDGMRLDDKSLYQERTLIRYKGTPR